MSSGTDNDAGVAFGDHVYLRCTRCRYAFSIETTADDDRCTECDGVLIVATIEVCPWCGGEADPDSTCPRSLECPTCAQPAGAPCRRPSGHNCDLHAARVAAADCCPRCGQTGSGGRVCRSCRDGERVHQGDAQALF